MEFFKNFGRKRSRLDLLIYLNRYIFTLLFQNHSNGLIKYVWKRPSSGVVSKAEIMVITDTPDYDSNKYVDVENIYEDPAEMPLGSAKNYPDVKTTVL